MSGSVIVALDGRPTKLVAVPILYKFSNTQERDTYFSNNESDLVDDLFVLVGNDLYQYDEFWKKRKENAYDSQSIINDEGSQYVYTAVADAVSGTVVLRSHGGQISLGDPSVDENAATKKYVDDLVADIVVFQPVPTTASSPGTAGQMAYDSTYFYLCVATDTWVRAELTTWA